MSKQRKGLCTICENISTALHWHHTVPQSLGGKDSLQIPLCGDCHTTLHAIANEVCAFTRSGKSKHKYYWATDKQEANAQKYSTLLIEVQLRGVVDIGSKEYSVPVPIPATIYNMLHLLKKDLGHTSIKATILYCISKTLSDRGLLNYEHQNSTKDKRNFAKPTLWGMQWSEKR